VFELLTKNKQWTNVGEGRDRKVVAEDKDLTRGKNNNLVVEVTNINGNIESHPIASMDTVDAIFQDATNIVRLAEISDFLRIGVRFFFLHEAKSFEIPLNAFKKQVHEDYWNVLGPELTDMSIISTHKVDDQFVRVCGGPLSKKEYPAWFSAPSSLEIENAFLLDVDCSTREYRFKTFSLSKVVDLYYNLARKRAVDLFGFLQG
jgi:hypothetical protein